MLDFRDQTIYYIVIDRFHQSSEISETDEISEELDHNRKDWNKYWGGTIQDIINKLDYLFDMGITAICLSPIYELNPNLEDFEKRGSNKYYGYWPKDFKLLNRNFVKRKKDISIFENNKSIFDDLIFELKKKNMKLIIDMVCNYSYSDNSSNKTMCCENGKFLTSSNNDILSWYHIYDNKQKNWQNDWQLDNQKLGLGLGQFNEYDIGFRNFIKLIMKQYLNKGVDAFFANTVKNMPMWFWQEFISEMRGYKGNSFVFGEWHGGGSGNDPSIHFTNYSSVPILDFTLQKAIENALAKDNSSGFYLIDDVFKKDGKFKAATELVTFIENAGTVRFLSHTGNRARLEMAVNLIMTCRGIPFLFYGTEQYLHNDTDGGGVPYNMPVMDSWDPSSRIYQNIKKLAKVRNENIAIQRGYQQTRYITDNIFVFTRKYGNNYCLIAMNKGQQKCFDVAGVEMPDGEYQNILSDKKIVIEKNKIIQMVLEENETVVISKHSKIPNEKTMITFQLNGYDTHYGEVVKVVGSCKELGEWDVEKAPQLQYINSNTWMGDVSFNIISGNTIYYKYVVVDYNGLVKYENRTARNRIVPLKGHFVWRNEWI